MNCPGCGADVDASRATCAHCGAGLMILHTVEMTANAWFNKALDCVRQNDHGSALEHVSACVALRPDDTEALCVQTKLWLQLGHPDEARRTYESARQTNPAAPGLAAIADALGESGLAETGEEA